METSGIHKKCQQIVMASTYYIIKEKQPPEHVNMIIINVLP